MADNKVKLLRKFIGFSIASWISAFIGFILTPIITRMIIPAELAKIDLFVTYCNIFIYAATLGLHQSYMRFYRELPDGFTKDSLLSFSVKSSAFATTVLLVAFMFLYKYLSNTILGYPTISIAVCMGIYIMSVSFLDIIKTKPRLEARIALYTFVVVATSVILKLSYLSYGIGHDVELSIIFITAAIFAFAIVVACLSRKSIFAPTAGILRASKLTVFKYALPVVPALLISNINVSLPKLLLNHFLDKSVVGIYAGALTLVSIIQLVQKGFTVFWAPYVFENYDRKQKEIQNVHLLVLFGMVACGFALILFQDIIYLILGESYRASRSIYAILLSAPIINTIGETVGIGISIEKKTYLNIVVNSCSLVVMLLLGYTLIPLCGNMGAAVSVLVSSAVVLLLKLIMGEKYYHVVCSIPKLILAPILYILAAFASAFFTDNIYLRTAITLFILLVHCLLFRNELTKSFAFVKHLLADRVHKKGVS